MRSSRRAREAGGRSGISDRDESAEEELRTNGKEGELETTKAEEEKI